MFKMFRKNLAAAGASAVLLAVVATPYAADLQLNQTTTSVTYATEIFGADSATTNLAASGMNVTLTVVEGTGVSAGGQGRITFDLSGGADFGATVEPNHFQYVPNNRTVSVSTQRVSGGAVGENQVVFSVTVGPGSNSIEAGDRFVFTVPSIRNARVLARAGEQIRVTAATNLVINVSGDNFQTGTSGVIHNQTVVATSADGIRFAINSDAEGLDDGRIALGNRTVITSDARGQTSNNVDTSGNGVANTRGLVLARVQLRETNNDEGEQATPAGTDLVIGAQDQVIFTVTGRFNTGDTVFLDDGDNERETSELFTIEGGQAIGTITANQVTNNGVIYYVPGGQVDLLPSTFAVSGQYRFGADNYRTVTAAQMRPTQTTFTGLSEDGWALAIPNSAAATEIVNVRVTNEGSNPVTVFAQGYAENGDDLGFVELGQLTANQTNVFRTSHFETAFCSGDTTTCWEGRARFDFWSSGNISVQGFQRGNDNALRNMTSSVGLEVDAQTQQIVR